MVPKVERPLSGGSALITTPCCWRSAVIDAGSMNEGTSVLNLVTLNGLSEPGGS